MQVQHTSHGGHRQLDGKHLVTLPLPVTHLTGRKFKQTSKQLEKIMSLWKATFPGQYETINLYCDNTT